MAKPTTKPVIEKPMATCSKTATAVKYFTSKSMLDTNIEQPIISVPEPTSLQNTFLSTSRTLL